MNSKINIIIIATLFLVFTSMMQMNGVKAADNNNSKLRGADSNKDRGKIPRSRHNRQLEHGLNGCPKKWKGLSLVVVVVMNSQVLT
jgi:hypothetical protein